MPQIPKSFRSVENSVFRLSSIFSTRASDRPQRYRELCTVLDGIFGTIRPLIRAGTTTADIDHAAAEAIAGTDCDPLFKNNPRNAYPRTITTSINNQVVNNVPTSRKLESGDLLSLQIGITRKGAFAYQAWTYCVDGVNDQNIQLWQAGFDALVNSVSHVRRGAKVRDVSAAIQSTLQAAGFAPGHDFMGHGIGDELHAEPSIPCFVGGGRSQAKSREYTFVENQLLSINVFGHAGSHRTKLEPDQWGVVTRDGSNAVHFSHIVLVEPNGCTILTSDHSVKPV